MKTSVLALALCVGSVRAFSINNIPQQNAKPETMDRRSMLAGAAALLGGAIAAPSPASARMNLGDPNSVVGREIRSFNGLVNEFKNTSLNGGLDASKLNEPSVPFTEFGEKMKNGEVAFVEFMAPFGEAAYVTFKPGKGQKKSSERIRIGQGYPTYSKDSWSSPDYVIRSVSNFGVPYKFTVPALAKYK